MAAWREAYASLGAAEEFERILKEGRTTADTLQRVLDISMDRAREQRYAFSPTSFDASDEQLRALPRALDTMWREGERAFEHYGSTGVMVRTPIYWQFGLPIYRACRERDIPIFVNEPENIPVGAMSLQRGGIDTVVCESIDAFAFSSYIAEKKLPYPRLWVLIHRANTPVWTVPGGITESKSALSQEVHLFPGVPLLVQCAALADERSTRFHVADAFDVELGASSFVSSRSIPLPLYRYVLPFSMRSSGACTCGKGSVEKL